MRLPSIFGRSASARERPSGLRNVRRVGRTQHLGFRKQLRTFMCFTTEEKLSQGASGDKRKRKRGSLSQRLRLTESSEDQSCSLDVMTQLVLRTSTGTPPPLSTVTDADPIDAPTTQLRRGAALSPVPADSVEASVYHEPSSLTLTSLDEDQLNAYLKVMFERCRTEPEERIAAEGDPGQFDGVEQTASADQQPDGNEALKRPIVIEEKNAQSCPGITTGESKRCSRKPILRAQCEELIRRHEELFGPIVIGEPTPASDAVASATATGSERRPPSLSHCLRQPRSELAGCEPCLPLVPLGAHLSIPQDRGQGPEWAEWRHHFSSGPDGVWRIVPPAQEAPEEAEAVADAAPLPADADARPKRLLGSLRDRCKALFRHDEKSEKACDGFGDALPMSANAHGRDLGSGTKPRSELVISEAKAQEILMEMKDEAIELCTSHHQMCPLVQTSCDPETYNSHSFRHWKRFFRPRSRELPSTGTSRDPKAVTSGSVEIPRAYVERLAADLASRGLPARDRLPVTGWWGTSPLLEAVLQVVPAATDGARTAATLACLRALSRRVRDTGLSGLVACLGGDPAVRRPEDRQAAWLTRPELPQLFAAAGFGPAEMTRWVLHLPGEQGARSGPCWGWTAAADVRRTPLAETEVPCAEEAPRWWRKDGCAVEQEAETVRNSGTAHAECQQIQTVEEATVGLEDGEVAQGVINSGSKSVQKRMDYSVHDPVVKQSAGRTDTDSSERCEDDTRFSLGTTSDDVVLSQINISLIEATQFSTGWEATNSRHLVIEKVAAKPVAGPFDQCEDNARRSSEIDVHRVVLKQTDTSLIETPATQFRAEWEATNPRHTVVEDVAAKLIVEPLDQCENNARPTSEAVLDHHVLRQTDTSFLEIPAMQFSPRSAAADNLQDDSEGIAQSPSPDFILASNMAMPMCSDVCTFLPSTNADQERALNRRPQIEPNAAYDAYETRQWRDLDCHSVQSTDDEQETFPPPSSRHDPVGAFDSETELGANLERILANSRRVPVAADCHHSQLRNSSVRPIDSEVDLAQVLHEQSGYAALGGGQAAPASSAYQALALHEVDSETELGLALPPSDCDRPLSEAEHRQVKTYDSEVDMASLVASLHGVDSETEMAERLRRLEHWTRPSTPPSSRDSPTLESVDSELGLGSAHGRLDASSPPPGAGRRHGISPEPASPTERQAPRQTGSVTRLPAAPVPVDSETEMGVVLRLFEQGMLSSRYFAGVPLQEDGGAELKRLTSFDTDFNISMQEGRSGRPADKHENAGKRRLSANSPVASDALCREVHRHTADGDVLAPCNPTMDEIYDASRRLSRSVINKALAVLGNAVPTFPLSRQESSPFGPSTSLDCIELENEMSPEAADSSGAGACDPGRVVPEVSLTTSDGSFVVLFPSHAAVAADFFETEERMVVRVERRRPVAESRGFQPAEVGLSLSEQEVGGATRRLRGAEAGLRRPPSPSPRARASDEGGLRVLYRATGEEPWQPVSPEGLSGLALAPADPELAAVRWRKNSRGEDGDAEARSGGEAVAPAPDQSQSQTEVVKAKPALPPGVGAKSWC